MAAEARPKQRTEKRGPSRTLTCGASLRARRSLDACGWQDSRQAAPGGGKTRMNWKAYWSLFTSRCSLLRELEWSSRVGSPLPEAGSQKTRLNRARGQARVGRSRGRIRRRGLLSGACGHDAFAGFAGRLLVQRAVLAVAGAALHRCRTALQRSVCIPVAMLGAPFRRLRGGAKLQAARLSRSAQPSLRNRSACDRSDSTQATLADVRWFESVSR